MQCHITRAIRAQGKKRIKLISHSKESVLRTEAEPIYGRVTEDSNSAFSPTRCRDFIALSINFLG